MTAKIIDGKAVALEVENEFQPLLSRMIARGVRPGLTVIRVGHDPASEMYVRSKARKAEQLGLRGVERHLPDTITQDDLLEEIAALNANGEVDGILVQLPLPRHIDSRVILAAIDPEKDVDGFHPLNVGRLHQGLPNLIPCTPAGVIRLIESTGMEIAGSRACVVGRSDIVGKPVAALLLQRHATVTICHSQTRDLAATIREGEIVIAAVGKPHLIQGDMIRPGAVVIDVGTSLITHADQVNLPPGKLETLRTKGSTIIGDVDFEGARKLAGWITPVPGGVGPMTIVMLMRNTVRAAMERRG
jgi:methylenetetrahydrofolate dehydrogenase (NADP+)/methenyltetrahydrofolate cyclohydrolase